MVLVDASGQFALLEAGPLGVGRVAIKRGGGDTGRGAVRLVFEVADLDTLMGHLDAHGVAFDGPSVSAEGYREVKVVDPDETPVGLFEWVVKT